MNSGGVAGVSGSSSPDFKGPKEKSGPSKQSETIEDIARHALENAKVHPDQKKDILTSLLLRFFPNADVVEADEIIQSIGDENFPHLLKLAKYGQEKGWDFPTMQKAVKHAALSNLTEFMIFNDVSGQAFDESIFASLKALSGVDLHTKIIYFLLRKRIGTREANEFKPFKTINEIYMEYVLNSHINIHPEYTKFQGLHIEHIFEILNICVPICKKYNNEFSDEEIMDLIQSSKGSETYTKGVECDDLVNFVKRRIA